MLLTLCCLEGCVAGLHWYCTLFLSGFTSRAQEVRLGGILMWGEVSYFFPTEATSARMTQCHLFSELKQKAWSMPILEHIQAIQLVNRQRCLCTQPLWCALFACVCVCTSFSLICLSSSSAAVRGRGAACEVRYFLYPLRFKSSWGPKNSTITHHTAI